MITAAARSKRLCRLSDLRGKLGLSGVVYDAELERIIEATGLAFAAVLEREPWHQTYQEKLPGEGGIFLPLSRWPIVAVTSVTEDGTSVSSADYEVAGSRRDTLLREDGWLYTSTRTSRHTEMSGDEDQTYEVAYTAGWLMPSEVSDWDGGQAYELGEWVRGSDPTTVVLFECTTAGTADTTEPTWDTTEGEETSDNTVTWTARGAQQLPRDIEQAALMRSADLYHETLADPMVASESFDTMRVQYREGNKGLSDGLVSLLKQYT